MNGDSAGGNGLPALQRVSESLLNFPTQVAVTAGLMAACLTLSASLRHLSVTNLGTPD